MSISYIEPAKDLVQITPVASAIGTGGGPGKVPNIFYRSIYVSADGDYGIELPGSAGSFKTIPLFKGMNPIMFISVHTGAPGTVWGVV